jgi:hypothetical protein
MTPKFDKMVSQLKKKYGSKETCMGLEVEKEHDDVTKGDKVKRAKIAKAHLKDEPKYYEKLKKYVEN